MKRKYTHVRYHEGKEYELVPGIKMPAKGQFLSENFAQRVTDTVAERIHVPDALRPLFDHVIRLALDAYKRGYAARAGRELRHARKLATKTKRSR